MAKAQLKSMKAFVLAMFAGVFIAMGSLGSVVSAVSLHGAAERVIRAAVFPAGLAFVVVAGAELFTGNMLVLVAALERRVAFVQVLRQWAIVYAGNAAGSLLVAVWTVASGLPSVSDGWVGRAFVITAVSKVSLRWGQAFLRGVGCNFLVCIAVWVSFSTKNTAGKMIALWPAIFIFVVCGMEHSVANMSAIPTGMLVARFCALDGIPVPPTVWQFVWCNLIPVTLGNMVGGALVAAGYFFGYRAKK